MKVLSCFLLSYCLLLSNSFIEKIIDDFRSNSMYLSLNIKANDYNGAVIIENDDLYLYYKITYDRNKQEYKSFVKDILAKKSFLDIGNQSTEKWSFIKVKEFDNIKTKLNRRGLANFIKSYFNKNLTEKGNTNEEEKAFIIKILFDNERSCYVDDETGLLILNEN